ncbi:MAG: hypothetical protein EHM70_11940 [Chloroflexota bacterium]|nr:MAG: hypothetical protein EHM70_11940 [Chloroflexota bacterium]
MKKILLFLACFLLLAALACNWLSVPRTEAPAGPPAFIPPTEGLPPVTQPEQAATSTPLPAVTATIPPAFTPTPLPVPSSVTAPAEAATLAPPLNTGSPYAVILVAQNDSLNVRQAAGTSSTVVEQLPAQATGIHLTGREAAMDGDRWVEIQRSGGGTGWVNAIYLAEYVSPQTFCADQRVTALIDDLDSALSASDGEKLSALVSPAHGLNLHYLRAGTVANYSPAEARFVFTSEYVANWGIHPGSGMDVKGTFHGEVLPTLLDLFNASYEMHCSDIVTGGTTYITSWPYEYRNINFYSLVKPGSPGVELDWRTWLAGVEYVDGKPYLFALMHFFWEP